MRKLIWHHNNRTGGTTMENMWRSDIDIFHCDKNAFRKGPDFNYRRIREADIVHLHSNGICPLFDKYFKDKAVAWHELLSNSMRLSVVRDPVSKFESEWGSYVERKNGKMLPHVPNFNLDALNNPGASDLERSGFYMAQKKEAQININDWMQVYCDHHIGGLPGPDHDAEKIFKKNKLSSASAYYRNTFSDAYGSNGMRFFLGRNRQFYALAYNLSLDFILKPRKPYKVDILLANENLDNSLAGLIYFNNNVKDLTIFKDQDLSFESLLASIKGLRTHSRSDKFKLGSEFKMNALNRQRFYLLNREEFTLWQSAVWSGAKFLSSLR